MKPPDRFDFVEAGPADEPEIRRLVGGTPMPGSVAIRFEREPDYFLGCSIMGDPCDVLIARHLPDGELAGMLCRAERPAFVNGRETRIGYIGQIRAAPRFEGRWLLQRGLPLFRRRSPPGMLYFGVMARENPRARGAFLGPRRAGGFGATRLAGWTTHALVLRAADGPPPPRWRRGSGAGAAGLTVGHGSLDTIEEIVDFLRRVGARRQLYPAYRVDDFVGGARTRGLALGDLLVARRAGSIVGVVGMWDQSAFKQDMVASLGPALGRIAPAYDLGARLLGARPLPRPGQMIRAGFAALVAVDADDPGVLQALLREARALAWDRGLTYLTIGLADRDPLLRAMRRSLAITYRSDLFVLSWDAGGLAGRLDARIPYIEIATL